MRSGYTIIFYPQNTVDQGLIPIGALVKLPGETQIKMKSSSGIVELSGASNNIAGGTWTPIITGDGTVANAMYTRINNIVTFSMRLNAARGTSSFTLPISSDFTDASDLVGTVVCFPDVGTDMKVEADATLNRGSVQVVSSYTNALITGQYIVK